jgi:hypothetical protein
MLLMGHRGLIPNRQELAPVGLKEVGVGNVDGVNMAGRLALHQDAVIELRGVRRKRFDADEEDISLAILEWRTGNFR